MTGGPVAAKGKTMVDNNNKYRNVADTSKTISDVTGGLYPHVESGANPERPPSESVTLPKKELGKGENQEGLQGGQPVFHKHENKYQEGTPHGLSLGESFISQAGVNVKGKLRYFVNTVPLDKAFRITEIQENFAVYPSSAQLIIPKLQYFILKDKMPIYRGIIAHSFLNADGFAAINSHDLFHNATQRVDIWISQGSRLGIAAQINVLANVSNVARFLYFLQFQGYLATPPYPLGKGLNERYSTTLSEAEFNALIASYETF